MLDIKSKITINKIYRTSKCKCDKVHKEEELINIIMLHLLEWIECIKDLFDMYYEIIMFIFWGIIILLNDEILISL